MKTYVMNQPLVPDVEAFAVEVGEVFASHHLANFGPVYQRFQSELEKYLGVSHVLPVTNATVGLMIVFQALGITGEVITTPFTFPATYHVLFNLPAITPVFVDISPDNFCLDPEKVRKAITSRTSAILAVHAYGFPAAVEELEQIAREHNFYLIYDAAPCFGVKYNGQSLLNFGHASVLSFHATKVFNTAEGGAIVCPTRELYERLFAFINFGFCGEENITAPGLNAKLDEVRALVGLHNLRQVDGAIESRKRVVHAYLDFFRRRGLPDIAFNESLYTNPALTLNYTYFPIVISPSATLDRDRLYDRLRSAGIWARKYYYPTVLDLPLYREFQARYQPTPTARRLAQSVLCLPVNPFFTSEDCKFILERLEQLLVLK